MPDEWLEPTDEPSRRGCRPRRLRRAPHPAPREPGRVDGRRVMSHPYQYVVLRYVPRVDRGECLNVGVVVHSQSAGVLRCGYHLDEDAHPRRGAGRRPRRPARRARGGLHDVRAPPERGRRDPVDAGQAVRLDQRPPLDGAPARARCTAGRWPTPRPRSSGCSTGWSARERPRRRPAPAPGATRECRSTSSTRRTDPTSSSSSHRSSRCAVHRRPQLRVLVVGHPDAVG